MLATLRTPRAAAYVLWGDRHSVEAGQHSTWGGWYMVWFVGAYAAGAVVVLAAVGRHAYHLARSIKRRRFPRPRPA